MKTFRYLNAVLTVIAVLLTLNLWTLWTMDAPPRTGVEFMPTANAQGLPNSAAQRQQMISAIKEQTQIIKDMSATLKSGQVRVRIEAGK